MRHSFPFYKQLDAMDCGPACLRMIAKFYGKNFTLQTLRERSYITKRGVSLLGISDAAEECKFTVDGIGKAGLKIIEKEPGKLIKITGDGTAGLEFYFWIQIKEIEENDTRIKLTIKADLNPVMKMAAAKPLKSFVNMMVDKIEEYPFD